VDDWLLFDLEGPRSNNGRALGTASVYARDGCLVAHATQQGMVRLKRS
jgi:acyl-CoA thioesterase